MNIMTMTKDDFKDVPFRTPNTNFDDFKSVVIIPTDEIHCSGYMCMDFCAVNSKGEPICRLSGVSDVLHIDGVAGIGELKPGRIPDKVKPKGWSIDCLPCGYLRLFCIDCIERRGLKPDDMILSSYSIYAVTDDE